jgi:predicted RNA binding protein YcfA (HicA-like mRNA interferase family)
MAKPIGSINCFKKMPILTHKQMNRALQKLGFEEKKAQSKHRVFTDGKGHKIPLCKNGKDINPALLKTIITEIATATNKPVEEIFEFIVKNK